MCDQLAIYQADSYETVIRLDWYPSTKQEVRLKFQWIAIFNETEEVDLYCYIFIQTFKNWK